MCDNSLPTSRKRALRTSDNDTITSMITTMQDDRGYEDTSKNEETSWMTRICDLLSYILTSFSHGSRAEAPLQRSHQRKGEERRGIYNNETTSQEQTTTSTSDYLGSQCTYSTGASQHHYYNRYKSCDLECDIKEEEDILATCFHTYDVDIKGGECYMLNLPQPHPPTPTVFDGSTPTFPA